MECESQKNIMMAKLTALEQQAYQLAGHPFSLTCTDDVAQVKSILLTTKKTKYKMIGYTDWKQYDYKIKNIMSYSHWVHLDKLEWD